VALYRRDEDGAWPYVEDAEGETFPTSVGPVTIRKGKRIPEAVEAFKLDQARKRNLIKSDGAWGTQPEVMCVWRALSQLVRFYAPDVIGGMPVYTEADGLRATPNVSEGQGSGEGPGWGDMEPDLIERIQDVIRRAKAVGHGGLSDEPTIQQRLHGQPPERVHTWIVDAGIALDQMEPKDADVVEPITLTFGGETFTFDGNGEPYRTIDVALGEGKEAMAAVARDLSASAKRRCPPRTHGSRGTPRWPPRWCVRRRAERNRAEDERRANGRRSRHRRHMAKTQDTRRTTSSGSSCLRRRRAWVGR
jgi:hypothetical protein